MESQSIQCPSCGTVIEIEQVYRKQLEEIVRTEMATKYREAVAKAEAESKKKAEAEIAKERNSLLMEMKLREEEIELLRKSKREFREELEKKEQEFNEMIKAERIRLEQKANEQAKARAEQESLATLKALQEEIEHQRNAMSAMRQQELDLTKKFRELETEKESLRLESERRILEETRAIRDSLSEQIEERYKLVTAEKDKKIDDMSKMIDELNSRTHQGSQQLQGEVLEIKMEEEIRRTFVIDTITEVPKGVRGADIEQIVNTPTQPNCGKIIWELKNVKTWNKEFLQKLKDDMSSARADIGIIVTTTLPSDIKRFGMINGIWVSDYASALPLSSALREGLIAVAKQQLANVGREEKMALLYQYLTSPTFGDKLVTIADVFQNMLTDLNKEKQAMMKLWSKREMQIGRLVQNITGMRGELEGIIGGNALPGGDMFELQEYNEDDE
jgi:hypothetical protein